jgi:hypothetical protein
MAALATWLGLRLRVRCADIGFQSFGDDLRVFRRQ